LARKQGAGRKGNSSRGKVPANRNSAGSPNADTSAESSSQRKDSLGSGKLLNQLAYDKLKHLIITMAFRPGEYVNEAHISKTLRIGRTPVHQALNRLKHEGMVDVIPRKGVIVKAVSLNEILEVVEVRLVNETYCARLAASRAENAEIVAMEATLDEADEAVAASDVERQMMLDRHFHGLLAKAAKNEVLAELLQGLHDRSLRFWFISLRDRAHHVAVQAEHRAILAAVKARDPDAASAAISKHIQSFRMNVARFL
jgi:GntR family transcriptional regulator, rspAB operon transcriptional repressor